MRPIVLVLLGLLILAMPGAASAQAEIPPPVVQSLHDPVTEAYLSPWVGAAAGASAAIIGMNVWTGGALLAPALGPTFSGILGGSWLGLSALTPIGANAVFQTTSLVAVGVSGGLFGHWLGSE